MKNGISVIKIGGALVTESGAPDVFWRSVKAFTERSDIVVVHGGGPHATRVARMIGHEPTFVHGRRVTGDLDLEIVQWTMRGALNVRLVGQAARFGLRPVGICGADDAILKVHRRPPQQIDGQEIDFGWVGDVEDVDVDLLQLLVNHGRTPIVAPLGIDDQGQLYNVNADTVATSLAVMLEADELVMVADMGGVRRDPDDPATTIPHLGPQDHKQGVDEGWISAGMRAKLENAFLACSSGIPAVRIVGPEDLDAPDSGTIISLP